MKKGFTLIEVLITLSILAIISAIAIPNYNYIKEKVHNHTLITKSMMLTESILTNYKLNRDMTKTQLQNTVNEVSKDIIIENVDYNSINKIADVDYKVDGENYNLNFELRKNTIVIEDEDGKEVFKS
ncbi:prepilin-type N-terminal cleavage/methylation domain-containing protein [Clostridium cellulovorans]|uniref:Prepilin-type N-terminal cleavage/methylation domain-containing protein n=1 Tax=Clostridium cellulovorans (strain ATCC 35296 / DSM 3052 / OCM 3 / 743B) TaxID=573061 RepID=D9SLE3_CLOC7|nr:prepilin-type N-terminal cleavage/methylation domain-containing protein [Clostridium cellulovorans]ADL51659.1 hypothetical protein Clocel_1915 [Clostridium cellulovorans 743B]